MADDGIVRSWPVSDVTALLRTRPRLASAVTQVPVTLLEIDGSDALVEEASRTADAILRTVSAAHRVSHIDSQQSAAHRNLIGLSFIWGSFIPVDVAADGAVYRSPPGNRIPSANSW